MKLTTGILLLAMSAGTAVAQVPNNILQNTKDKLNAAQQQRVDQENAALASSQSSASKPAPAGKPVLKPAVQTAKPASKSVVRIKAIKPKPVAQANAAGSKATRMTAAKSAAAQPAAAKAPAEAAVKAAANKPVATKISVAPVAPQPKQGAEKIRAKKQGKAATQKQAATVPAPKKDQAKDSKAVSTDTAEPPKERKTITAEGRRDPFISPVVSRASGPSCSVGKRCLAIDQITVRGVVKSDNGMIAVVVNSLNKAYFLKENDPVYNGYVMKITGDSVVFKETVQDRLGKESTREVVKKITTPAV